MPIQKWEYKKLTSFMKEVDEEYLNQLGQEGWELVYWEDIINCIFKRPVVEIETS